jgi:transcriptional regulator with XRE-family HTH domain
VTTDRDPALVAFGEKVRAARERAGKRSGEFAAEMQVSRHTLQNIEAGRTRASNVIYWRIADALDLRLELELSNVLREVTS